MQNIGVDGHKPAGQPQSLVLPSAEQPVSELFALRGLQPAPAFAEDQMRAVLRELKEGVVEGAPVGDAVGRAIGIYFMPPGMAADMGCAGDAANLWLKG